MKPVATSFTRDPTLAGFALALLASAPGKTGMLSPAQLAEQRPDLARAVCVAASGRMVDPAAVRVAQALGDYFDLAASGPLDAEDREIAHALLGEAAAELRGLLPVQEQP